MTYNVFGGTLSLTQSINQSINGRTMIYSECEREFTFTFAKNRLNYDVVCRVASVRRLRRHLPSDLLKTRCCEVISESLNECVGLGDFATDVRLQLQTTTDNK